MMISVDEYRAKTDAAMGERELQDNVVACARTLNYLVYHTFDSRRSQAGFPDIVAVRSRYSGSPRTIFIELKATTGRISPDQRNWRAAIEQSGSEYHLWRPCDWSSGEIERILKGEE